MVERDEVWHAGIGAVVTIVLSFTGFSALLGGGIAGYLQRAPPRSGARVGAISGGLAIVPMLLVFVLGFGLFVAQPSSLGAGGMELAFILLVLFPLLFAWIVGLSALGGYLGAYLRAGTRSANGGAPGRGEP